MSVRQLSHAGILSKRLHIYSTFFSPSGSATILVFPHQIGWQYSDGDPTEKGGSNANGMKKITIFDQYRFISQMMQELLCCKMMQEFHSYYARRIRNHNIIYQPSWWSASMSIAIHHAQHDCFYQSVVWHTTYIAK